MPILSAGYRQENVVGKWLAFTRIKTMTKDYVSSGSNCMKHRVVILGAVQEINGITPRLSGKNKNKKIFRKVSEILPPT